jgi:hypothetical protein
MEATKELVGELQLDPEGMPVRKFDLEDLILVLASVSICVRQIFATT